MPLPNSYCSPEEVVRNAHCLLGRVEEVRGYLRRNGFSDHAVEQAVAVLHRAALPYVKGTKRCEIKNRRAWCFKVAIRAAIRAAQHEVRLNTVEPAKLAATVEAPEPGEELFDMGEALKCLTKQQRAAAELCILAQMSQRDAAREMGIAVGTLGGHLKAAKARLKEILPALMPPSCRKRFDPSAPASYAVEGGTIQVLTVLPQSAA